MRIAYFDCFSGAAGDMIVGALIDAGVDPAWLREQVARMSIGGFQIRIEKVKKQGIAATKFDVDLDLTVKQPHRHLKHVVEIIRGAGLSPQVEERSIAVFERLAHAEAAVHGTTIEKVHFHEVGAIDAILDVVCACICLDRLGIEHVHVSSIPTGSGTVRCDHGVMPVPAPATALLLKGIPLADCDESGELTTPTGAAILTTIAKSFGPAPGLTIESIGYGAGSRENKTRPNVLRVLVGNLSPSASSNEVMVLETNLDDASPQVVGFCIERLLEAGAWDAFALPIQMKKGRPGVLLTALVDPLRAAEFEGILFRETPTFGVRRRIERRSIMERRHETVRTSFGEIRMKVGRIGEVVTATPEYEDCKAAALSSGAPLREVIAAATATWRNR